MYRFLTNKKYHFNIYLNNTSDEQCISFLSTCVSKGIGCIDQSEPCSSYNGNNTTECSKFKGLNNTKQCWWIGGSTCVNKECIQDTISTNNDQCEQFLSGCVTKGIGCIENTQLCTAFQGDETQCSNFIGNGFPCVRKNACMNRSCSDLINPSSNDQCTAYLPNCRFNGSICIDAQTSCSSYLSLNYQICQQITTISGEKCYLSSGTSTFKQIMIKLPNILIFKNIKVTTIHVKLEVAHTQLQLPTKTIAIYFYLDAFLLALLVFLNRIYVINIQISHLFLVKKQQVLWRDNVGDLPIQLEHVWHEHVQVSQARQILIHFHPNFVHSIPMHVYLMESNALINNLAVIYILISSHLLVKLQLLYHLKNVGKKLVL